jgi:N-methylhydantoinase B
MTGLTPFTIQAISNRIASILNEQQTALIRTAFSTVVRESEDLACGLFNAAGQMIAQSITGTPGHINSMATGVRHFVEAFPPERLEPGDVLITNDPWKTAGQVNDFTIVTPVFNDEGPIAYFASTCHAPDIGGRQFSGEAREVYEEGLQIPMLKIVSAGKPNDDVLDIIRMNVRQPEETVGDIYAQISSNEVGVRRLTTLLAEFGLRDVEEIGHEVISRSEQAMRAGIAALPDGTYTNEAWTDGFDEPIVLRCTVVVSGDEISVDWDGSSPQSLRGINLVLNYTHAYTSYAMKAALAPDVPHNDGAFRPVHVSAPVGSILNCEHPAPVASRHVIGHFLPGIIFGALAPAMPGRLLAGSADALWITVWQGRNLDREPFSQAVFQLGGMGARPTKDGLSATGFPSGVAGMPAEVIESLCPLVLQTRGLISDSGGAGRFRGGLGQVRVVSCSTNRPWSVSGLLDRTHHPAPGLEGGGSGAVGEFRIVGGDDLPLKRVVSLDPDAAVALHLPGGGGFGNPFLRDPERVLDDVVDGYVSIERARSDYGVAIEYVGPPDALVRPRASYRLDVAATDALRARGSDETDAGLALASEGR